MRTIYEFYTQKSADLINEMLKTRRLSYEYNRRHKTAIKYPIHYQQMDASIIMTSRYKQAFCINGICER